MKLIGLIINFVWKKLTGGDFAGGGGLDLNDPTEWGIFPNDPVDKKFLNFLQGLPADLAKEHVEIKGWNAKFLSSEDSFNLKIEPLVINLWIKDGVVVSATSGGNKI